MAVKRDKLDDIFSKVIREAYDYCCQSCHVSYRHDPGYMHCAHVHTRKHRNTRWDAEIGAVALCARCHRRYTDYPLEWADFCRGFFGDSNYADIKRRAWEVRKFTKAEREEMYQHYKAQLKYMQRRRLEGAEGVLPIVTWL